MIRPNTVHFRWIEVETGGARRPPRAIGQRGQTLQSTIQVLGPGAAASGEILTGEALAFLADLSRAFESKRQALMAARRDVQAEIDGGRLPNFPVETADVRQGGWRVAPAPADLEDRRVEITGPSSDRKMVINALNSGAQVYMADLEDAHSPGWTQTLDAQLNVRDASNQTIAFTNPDGREYRLNDQTATLVVRPRGLHLTERHVHVDGWPISASLFDFGLALFHNAKALLARGSGPYFYIPKLQGRLEARWWNAVFDYAEDRLGLSRDVIRSTVLIEHILAAFEMEEILYEKRGHVTALNLGRWDYIFSFIKTFGHHEWALMPERAQVTMATTFLRSAAELMASVCHKRGAHALGGMSAYIPRRDDPESNEQVLAQVRADKEREASQGCDGAWVAHPGLVPVVREVFQQAFSGPNQLGRIPEARVTAEDLLDVPQGEVTETGLRNNISVALQYLETWVRGTGAVAILGLMEDTATAEIARSQIWQWISFGTSLSDGRRVTEALYRELRVEETAKLLEARGPEETGALDRAVELLDELVTAPECAEFLTIPGNRYLA